MARLPGQPFNRISSQESINSYTSDIVEISDNKTHISPAIVSVDDLNMSNSRLNEAVQELTQSIDNDIIAQHNERRINIFGQEWILNENREYLIEHENGSIILKESGNILAVHDLAPSDTVIIRQPVQFEITSDLGNSYTEVREVYPAPYNDYAPTYQGQEAELLQKELELKAELEMQTKLKEACTSIETYKQDSYTPQIKKLKNILRNIRTNSAQTSLKP